MRRLALLAVSTVLVAGCGGSHHQNASGSVHPQGWGRPAPSSTGVAAVSTREMFDTITLSALSGLKPTALAGYTAGSWPTYLPLVRAYPHAVVKSIAIGAGLHAQCLDVEPGDASPAQTAGWVRADIAAGFKRPCVYSSYWEFINQVRPVLARAGIARGQVWEWDASYTGRPGVTPGFDATQWTNHAYGRNLDESTATLGFLGVSPPKPKPKPKPKPVRLVCFGKKAQLRNKKCAAPRRQVARLTVQRNGLNTQILLVVKKYS